MRRFGEPPRRGIVYADRPGAYAVILERGSLLVTEQAEPELELQLPGGGIDPGESPLQALHREALEETGWRLRVRCKLGVYQRFAYMPEYDRWARKICHIYLCAPGLWLHPPTEPGHRAFWMEGAKALPELVSPGDRHFVARSLCL